MSSIRTAGRDSAVSCLFAALLLGIVGVVAWPVLTDASIPLWRRLAAVTGGPVLAWVGVLVVLAATGAAVGGVLTLRDRARDRKFERLVDALARGGAPLDAEDARTLEWVLARDDWATSRRIRAETPRLLDAARSEGPGRLPALRLLLRHGDGWDEDGPVRSALRDGAALLEAAPLGEEERKRLGWWVPGPG